MPNNSAIKKRRILEEELKASEQRFRELFERVQQGVIITTKEGRVVDCNQAILDMLGYPSKKAFLSIDIEKELYANPLDRKRFQQSIEQTGYVKDFEVNFKRKNGEEITILITCNARFDSQGNVIGYQGLNVDITERKKMEKDLQEANQFLSKLIESSPDCIIVADTGGNILIFNQGAEELLGYTSEEVIGTMNIKNIYPPGVAKEVMKKIRNPDEGGTGRLKSLPIVHIDRDGEMIDGNLSACIIYDDIGTEMATVFIFTDLRPRLTMEKRLRETQQQLLQSEKLSAMGKLTSQIAHELNNPLYGIMNTLELLKTEIPTDSKRRKILDMSLSEATRVTDMLKKMLSFSKPKGEERQMIDINKLLQDIMLFLEKQFWESSIKLKTSFSRKLPPVPASPNQLRQVILNVIANAKHAMPRGGVLTLKTLSRQGHICINIHDTGIGIPEAIQDKIFDAFFTTKHEVKGVGLGLSVCYGIIKDHGGNIKVKSSPTEGTTFSIMLPRGHTDGPAG